MENKPTLIELASQIVAAYVGRNAVEQADLPKLITDVHKALEQVAGPTGRREDGSEPKPPVSIRKSITPDYLICLEDGKKFKSLKRHLRTHFNLTPEQYREKWGLRPTTRWWRPTTPIRVRTLPRTWVSASARAAESQLKDFDPPDSCGSAVHDS